MDLEQQAIEWLKLGSDMSLRYYGKPLLLTYSGGKDSDICLELAKRSGIPFEVQHSHTTVDAPQTVYHVRKKFYDLECQGIHTEINYPRYKGKRVSMWDLISMKGTPPTRIFRYCCVVCKESIGSNRQIITGVRKYESNSRSDRGNIEVIASKKENRVSFTGDDSNMVISDYIFINNDNSPKRKIIEQCQKQGKTTCNPILDWQDNNVWDFIRSENIDINLLYQMGFDRVGCIGCPAAAEKRWYEFNVFPTYKSAYIRAFDRMLVERSRRNLENKLGWKSGKDVFYWWMEDKNIEGQLSFLDCKIEEE
jgi:phosphoadenosine phosphosulfate reductase